MTGLLVSKREEHRSSKNITGHPSTLISDDKIDEICTKIHEDRSLTVHEIAEELGVSVGSCYEI